MMAVKLQAIQLFNSLQLNKIINIFSDNPPTVLLPERFQKLPRSEIIYDPNWQRMVIFVI